MGKEVGGWDRLMAVSVGLCHCGLVLSMRQMFTSLRNYFVAAYCNIIADLQFTAIVSFRTSLCMFVALRFFGIPVVGLEMSCSTSERSRKKTIRGR